MSLRWIPCLDGGLVEATGIRLHVGEATVLRGAGDTLALFPAYAGESVVAYGFGRQHALSYLESLADTLGRSEEPIAWRSRSAHHLFCRITEPLAFGHAFHMMSGEKRAAMLSDDFWDGIRPEDRWAAFFVASGPAALPEPLASDGLGAFHRINPLRVTDTRSLRRVTEYLWGS